mgnify:FL=1
MKTPFKMKGFSGYGNSPMKKKDLTKAEKQANLLKAVPNQAAYDALSSDEERAAFDIAAKAAGLPQKKKL